MNENIHRAQVTTRAMKSLMSALEDVIQQLPKNPKLFAFLSESPVEDLRRMCDELDELLEPLKTSPATSAAQLPTDSISSPAAPGPIESTS
jgi:hypothetical protein